jgi:hypothetical protein
MRSMVPISNKPCRSGVARPALLQDYPFKRKLVSALSTLLATLLLTLLCACTSFVYKKVWELYLNTVLYKTKYSNIRDSFQYEAGSWSGTL